MLTLTDGSTGRGSRRSELVLFDGEDDHAMNMLLKC